MTRRRKRIDSDSLIVMTPMIDVMTVLLAVFVVTAPMLTSGIDLDLPRAGHSSISGDDHAIQIGVDIQGRYFVGTEQRTREEIVERLVAMRGENPKLAIMINGDRGASYGAVMAMMGSLKDAGFQKVGLRTKLEN
ncbi:MAG: biopolymer transporter ExbD [Alphaproteobacteria bacterium]|nr:biopolymer transporter ExbD [Alphaproteobacteria bacterium]